MPSVPTDQAALDRAVVVALGCNMPGAHADCGAAVRAASDRLESLGVVVINRSSLWRSAAWPDPARPAYINAVALVETSRSPQDLLALLHRIEAEFGRAPGPVNADRPLDLDLVAYGRLRSDGPDLVVPHPRAAERLFVMGPLAEIAPGWVHPRSGKTAAALALAATVGRDAAPCPKTAEHPATDDGLSKGEQAAAPPATSLAEARRRSKVTAMPLEPSS